MKTVTVKKKFGCANCGQENYARAPADKYTAVTDKACELPELDFPQNVECEHCYFQNALFWHNEDLERKQILSKKTAFLQKQSINGIRHDELNRLNDVGQNVQGFRELSEFAKGRSESGIKCFTNSV